MNITLPASLLQIGDIITDQNLQVIDVQSYPRAPSWMARCVQVTAVDADDPTSPPTIQAVNRNQLIAITRGV